VTDRNILYNFRSFLAVYMIIISLAFIIYNGIFHLFTGLLPCVILSYCLMLFVWFTLHSDEWQTEVIEKSFQAVTYQYTVVLLCHNIDDDVTLCTVIKG